MSELRGAPVLPHDFHDHYLRAWSIDWDTRTLTMRTLCVDRTTRVDAVFAGVVAYWFVDDGPDNILDEIVELPTAELVQREGELFTGHWPWRVDYKTLDDLTEKLTRDKVRAFDVVSSMGSSGWILALSVACTSSCNDVFKRVMERARPRHA